jgi:hypothetical protein
MHLQYANNDGALIDIDAIYFLAGTQTLGSCIGCWEPHLSNNAANTFWIACVVIAKEQVNISIPSWKRMFMMKRRISSSNIFHICSRYRRTRWKPFLEQSPNHLRNTSASDEHVNTRGAAKNLCCRGCQGLYVAII